jgi:hypothetical protein
MVLIEKWLRAIYHSTKLSILSSQCEPLGKISQCHPPSCPYHLWNNKYIGEPNLVLRC